MNRKKQKTVKFSSKKPKQQYFIYGAYILLTIFALGATLYAYASFKKIIDYHIPLGDAAMEAQICLFNSHVKLEEVILDKSNNDYQPVFEAIANTRFYLSGLLEGAKGSHCTYKPIKETKLRSEVEELLRYLDKYTEITRIRINTLDKRGEEEYHRVFGIMRSKMHLFDLHAFQHIQTESTALKRFTVYMILASITCFLLFFFIMKTFITYQLQTNNELLTLNTKLDASNQQLDATNQRLSASNQQLDAANQQLKASNQQLDAANQQLKAANQQQDATNQQLRASNQQLDVTNQQLGASEIKINETLKEKEILIKEIHHRVKNNLHMIASLLNIQKRQIKDKQARRVIDDCIEKILSLAMLYDELTNSDNVSQIDIREFLRKLVNSSKSSLALTSEIKTELDVMDFALEIDIATPFVLVLNELISNVFKHAFKGRKTGNMKLSVKLLNNKDVIAVIRDNGIGMNIEKAFSADKNTGLKLVKLIIESQLEGTINFVSNNSGTEVKIMFSLN